MICLYDVRYFPKEFFPSDNFPRVFSQVATSQMCKFPKRQLPKSVPALGPYCSLRESVPWEMPLGKYLTPCLHSVSTFQKLGYKGYFQINEQSLKKSFTFV